MSKSIKELFEDTSMYEKYLDDERCRCFNCGKISNNKDEFEPLTNDNKDVCGYMCLSCFSEILNKSKI